MRFIDADQIHPSVSVSLTFGQPGNVPPVGDSVIIEQHGEYDIRAHRLVWAWHGADVLFSVNRRKRRGGGWPGDVTASWGFLSLEDARRFLHEHGRRRFLVSPESETYEVRECLGVPRSRSQERAG